MNVTGIGERVGGHLGSSIFLKAPCSGNTKFIQETYSFKEPEFHFLVQFQDKLEPDKIDFIQKDFIKVRYAF